MRDTPGVSPQNATKDLLEVRGVASVGRLEPVAVVFDGEIPVHYGYLFLLAEEEQPELGDARGGQVNGLCGAAYPGVLSLVTGLHTGAVPLVIEVLDEEPALGEEWEDVVEVSFATDQTELGLSAFQDHAQLRLPSPGTYRARYCATGMDRAREQDVRLGDQPAPDRYLLQL